MEITVGENGLIKIMGELTIYTATEMTNHIKSWVSRDAIEIDLSCAAEIDVAGLQTLMVLQREFQKRKKPIKFVSISSEVKDVICFLRVEAVFGLPTNL